MNQLEEVQRLMELVNLLTTLADQTPCAEMRHHLLKAQEEIISQVKAKMYVLRLCLSSN